MSWTTRVVARGCLRASSAGTRSLIVPSATTTTPAIITSVVRSAGIATATHPLHMPLDEFRDATTRQQRMAERVGRSWSAKELRRKSFPDLHKLWYVLYKERNMLFTEKQLSRRKGIIFPQPERVKKVRKSMGAIKQVLGERKVDKLAMLAARQMEEADNNFAEIEDMEEGDEEEQPKI